MTRLALAVIFTVLAILNGGVRAYEGVVFDIHCGDYLKRAADSNSIDLAEGNLAKVVDYAEANGLTEGNTGVLWKAPEWDVGFWYTNVKSSLAELRKVKNNPNASDLERSNVLMKLEKTMLDQGKDGSSVVIPDGISIFPGNGFFFFWLWGSLLIALFFWVEFFLHIDD